MITQTRMEETVVKEEKQWSWEKYSDLDNTEVLASHNPMATNIERSADYWV
jgi:phage portal protein BeeE